MIKVTILFQYKINSVSDFSILFSLGFFFQNLVENVNVVSLRYLISPKSSRFKYSFEKFLSQGSL